MLQRSKRWAHEPGTDMGLGDADGDQAAQVQHAVEPMDGDFHLGIPTLVGA